MTMPIQKLAELFLAPVEHEFGYRKSVLIRHLISQLRPHLRRCDRVQIAQDLLFRFGLFYLLILLGYLMSRVSQRVYTFGKVLNSLLINLLLPLLVLYTLLNSSGEVLVELLAIVGIAALVHILGAMLMLAGLRNSKLERRAQGALLLSAAFTNSIFLPIPLVLIFIGPQGIPVVALFSVVQVTLLAFLGPVVGSVYGGKKSDLRSAAQKVLLFPPLMAVFLALALLSVGVALPPLVASSLSLSGTLTTYLALLEVGISVGHRFSFVNARTALQAIVIRQVVVPAIVLVLLLFIGLSELTTKVLILEAMMPTAVTTVVYAAGLDLDSELTATVVTVGTLLLLPAIPVLWFIIG
jgi:predicted permease